MIVEWVNKAKRGDKNAFKDLITFYQNDLYRIARSRLNSEDDIADAIQETILKAYQSIHRLSKSESFKSWLLKILINNCNDIYKRNKKILEYEIVANELEKSVNFESNLEFMNLMKVLDTSERTICILYYQDGYSTKEIANIVNMNHNTVRSKIMRAKQKLEKNLKEGIE